MALLLGAGARGTEAQVSGAVSLRMARLHEVARCPTCTTPTGLGVSAAARADWVITAGLEGGLEGQITTGDSWHSAAVLWGVGTGARRPGPWVRAAIGLAIVPEHCDITLIDTGTPPDRSAEPSFGSCGSDHREAGTLGLGFNIPLGGRLISPELTALATVGDPRFTLVTAGLAFRF